MSSDALNEIFSSVEPLKFAFPISSSHIESSDATSTQIKITYSQTPSIIAPFTGRLFFDSHYNTVTLFGDPTVELQMLAVFGDTPFVPANIKWYDVDINNIIQQFENVTNAAPSDFEVWREGFLRGDLYGHIECGDVIGNTSESKVVFQFETGDGTHLHSLYSLWNLRRLVQEGSFSSYEDEDAFNSNPIASQLNLSSINLTRDENYIKHIESDTVLGLYRNYDPNLVNID